MDEDAVLECRKSVCNPRCDVTLWRVHRIQGESNEFSQIPTEDGSHWVDRFAATDPANVGRGVND